jgi:hypothetical protein
MKKQSKTAMEYPDKYGFKAPNGPPVGLPLSASKSVIREYNEPPQLEAVLQNRRTMSP